ncbi:hypothetical protein [Paraburkholderia dipogonis]|uniref:hypothetical protein n=1 Tax=Paraburkholderia dipogonis TaxID=1211383 RepID=UPI0038B857AA
MTDVNKELARFKESLHAHFDAFPIPTQLGIIAIMNHIEKVYAEFSSAASPQPSLTAVVLDDERAPPSEYFVYDPNGGHVEFYETDAQRAEAHAEAVAEYRKESISDGEWSPDVECIVSGVVTHKTVSVNDDGETCDYEARAASPQPVEQTAEPSLTDEQREAIAIALSLIGLSGDPRVRNVHKTLRPLTAAQPASGDNA